MPDGVAITAGSGTTILTDDTGAPGHAQVVKLGISTDGSATLIPSDATNGMLVDLGINNDVKVTATSTTGSLGVLNATTVLTLQGESAVAIDLRGTFVATVTFTGTVDGTNFIALPAIPIGSGVNVATVTTATAAGAWLVGCAGCSAVRVQATAYTSGTVTTTLRGVQGNQWNYVAPLGATSAVSGSVTVSGTVTATPSGVALGVAEDAVISGNALRTGVRAHSLVPTAMSADNDFVTPWADRSGAQVVIPHVRQVRVTATPTISTTGYVAGDIVGAALTFTSAALASGRGGEIVNAVITNRTPTALNNLELWVFQASPTIASADNAAFDITDANLEAAQLCGIIDFAAGDWRTTASGAVCAGESMGGPVSIPFVASGSANLFGALVIRGTVAAQWAGTTDLIVALTIRQA
jgi:hypothetical protein